MIRITTLLTATFLMAMPSSWASGELASTTLWFDVPQELAEGGRMIDKGLVEEGMEITREMMRKSLGINGLAMAHTNLCAGYLHLGEYQEAMRECELGLKLRPRQWQALNNRGGANHGLGNFDAAISDFMRALILQPGNEDIAYNLNMARINQRATSPQPLDDDEG
jgi:tetratricopeptide (TPR) repeat protein